MMGGTKLPPRRRKQSSDWQIFYERKCRMAISMLMDCYTMNLLFERGQDENPRDLVCEYVADQPLGVFEMPQEDEIE